MSKKEYGGIRIIVHSEYISERSNPLRKRFFFSYRITIQNKGELPAKLLSRYWNITDAKGNVEEVRGPGVIGQQPRLEKGESFDYTSFCPLRTEFGIMKGTYKMVSDSGETFDAEIPVFHLVTPHAVN